VEDLLAERGIAVSYESIRQWCNRFGSEHARKLKKRQGRLGDTWYLDKVFIKINGELHYVGRANDYGQTEELFSCAPGGVAFGSREH